MGHSIYFENDIGKVGHGCKTSNYFMGIGKQWPDCGGGVGDW